MWIIEKEGKKRNLLPQVAEGLNKKISEKGTLWGFWIGQRNGKTVQIWESVCMEKVRVGITLHMWSNMKTLNTAEICCSAWRNPSGESRGPWVSDLAVRKECKDEHLSQNLLLSIYSSGD